MDWLVYFILGAGIAAVVLFLFLRIKKGGIAGLASKTFASLLFVLTASVAGMVKAPSASFAALIVVGLVFGLVGDIMLDLKVMHKEKSDTYFALGASSFFIGHIFYLAAVYIHLGAGLLNILIPLLAALVLSAITVLTAPMLGIRPSLRNRVICFFYGAILMMFAAASLWGMIATSAAAVYIVLFVGGAMFLVSDVVLFKMYFSCDKDGKKLPLEDKPVFVAVNHIAYYAAQFLIAMSIVALPAVL